MNLRILKKLSKRVAPVVQEISKHQGYTCFVADTNDNFTNTRGHDRKHWERMFSKNGDYLCSGDIKTKTKNGSGYIWLSQQYIHPWKNTEMIGWTYGYYEPEWEEETAWDFFKNHVWSGFNDYESILDSEDELGLPNFQWVSRRKLNNPSQYFKAFEELKGVVA